MKKILCLFVVLILLSCDNCWIARVVELENGFALVENDSKDIRIFYTYNRGKKCIDGRDITVVVPAKVVSYNYNEKWIIAKSVNLENRKESYWIVNKLYNYTRLGYSKEVKEQTIGPLDSILFHKKTVEFGIKLPMKSSRK